MYVGEKLHYGEKEKRSKRNQGMQKKSNKSSQISKQKDRKLSYYGGHDIILEPSSRIDPVERHPHIVIAD